MGPRGVFAERFALLYAEAGDPPLKRVTESVSRARRTDERGRPVRVPAQRVSDWRRGRNVPARFSGLSAVLEVLVGEARKRRPQPAVEGLYELDRWRALWEEALASPVTDSSETPPQPEENAVCPYMGLSAFGPQDANWFFGRERATNALLSRLEENGMTMLVGASGAGKSSLVKAGVLPRLSKNAVIITPGTDPLKELALRIPELVPTLEAATGCEIPAGFAAEVQLAVGDRVVVVDQFEEAFTLGGDENRLRIFVHALHAAAEKTAVVLGVRADFYARCLDFPELAEALQNRQMVLGAMSATEVRDAVTNPAKAAGLQLEPGLVDLMLRDLGAHNRRGKDAYDAGALPLLSHALLVTWQRRQAGRLTIAGYRAAGGIQGSVATTAERAWSDLDEPARAAARQLLLRLVRVGDDTQDTRRRSSRHSLLEASTNLAATERALEVLTRARLITLDAAAVEITHEALLHAWPRLRGWIDEDRAGNLARQRLEEDAAAWSTQGRDSSLLYRGARLEGVRQQQDVTAVAKQFVHASERQHRKNVWLGRSAVALVVVFALIAASAAVIAVRQRNDARFRQVVAEADRLSASDPSVSARLWLVAHRMRPDDQAVSAKLLATQQVPLAVPLSGHTGAVYLTTFSPDGTLLATASYDRTARLWDVRDRFAPKQLAVLSGHDDWVSSAVFSPDGRTLATTGQDATIRLWDVTDPASAKALKRIETGNGTSYLLEFSPDGTLLAAANEDRSARLWDVRDPANAEPVGEPLRDHSAAVRSLAFSPDGRTLATTGDDETVRLWDVATRTRIGKTMTGHSLGVHSVAFSGDGKLLASGGDDKIVRLWDPATQEPVGQPLAGHTGSVWSVKFRPDSRVLASGSADATVRLWNLADPAVPSPVGRPLSAPGASLFAVGFSPDGTALATGALENAVQLWSLPQRMLLGHTSHVPVPSFRPDGEVLATGSGDKTVRLWDIADPGHPQQLGPPLTGHERMVSAPAFRPDGKVLATAGGDQTVRLWDVADPRNARQLGEPLVLPNRFSARVVFRPDGEVLLTSHTDDSVRLWDVRDPARPVPLGEPLTGHDGYVNEAAFSPDGRTVATASSDRTVRLWDVGDPARPRLLGQPIEDAQVVEQALFTADGATLVISGQSKVIRLFDVRDREHPVPLSELHGHTGTVGGLSISADGRMLASSSADRTFRLWDITNPAAPSSLGQQITGDWAAEPQVQFSPRGSLLATGNADGVVRLWDLDVEREIERICTTTRTVLTEQQWAERLPQLEFEDPCD
ncbi:WD40 repeat [Lentzea fradiae]|uniref:WD40 repeat n=1 Tax=Lentzea fradiae TaxID=200378 RepID=A0A1G7X9M0_9PSEU|nr:WD40 repeat domain-containing protein [Lentzea fradiae]SDG80939.1 WD40 repeat [Lentzea fradiae]